MRSLIVGCGYLGQRVADLLLSQGDEVFALTRSEERMRAFEDQKIRPVLGNVMEPQSLRFPTVDRVIYSVGYDRRSDYSKADTYVLGLENVLDVLSEVQNFTYVSSTSVYGQSNGEWVDENSETNPATDGGRICLNAERTLISHRADSNIIRLAGIYGPGRMLRRLNAMEAGEPLAGNPDAFLNLIHVADAARLVTQIANDNGPKLVLGSDGQPSTRREFYSELARLTETSEPTFDPTLPSRSPSAGLGKRCRSIELNRPNGIAFDFEFPSCIDGLRNAVGQA